MKHLAVFYSSRIRKAANKFIESELKRAGLVGIVPSHGDIIAYLMVNGKTSMQEIASRVDRTKATTTVLVDKLEKLGLAKREKSSVDTRVTMVELTALGYSYKDKFQEVADKLNTKVYKGLSDDEADVLEALLVRVKNNLEE